MPLPLIRIANCRYTVSCRRFPCLVLKANVCLPISHLLIHQHWVGGRRSRQRLEHSRQRVWRHLSKGARAWWEGTHRRQHSIRLRGLSWGGRAAAWRGDTMHWGSARAAAICPALLVCPEAKPAARRRSDRSIKAAWRARPEAASGAAPAVAA